MGVSLAPGVIFALLHALLSRVQAKNTRPVDVLLEDSFSAVALMKGVIASRLSVSLQISWALMRTVRAHLAHAGWLFSLLDSEGLSQESAGKSNHLLLLYTLLKLKTLLHIL
jgi:hypothetical protein